MRNPMGPPVGEFGATAEASGITIVRDDLDATVLKFGSSWIPPNGEPSSMKIRASVLMIEWFPHLELHE